MNERDWLMVLLGGMAATSMWMVIGLWLKKQEEYEDARRDLEDDSNDYGAR